MTQAPSAPSHGALGSGRFLALQIHIERSTTRGSPSLPTQRVYSGTETGAQPSHGPRSPGASSLHMHPVSCWHGRAPTKLRAPRSGMTRRAFSFLSGKVGSGPRPLSQTAQANQGLVNNEGHFPNDVSRRRHNVTSLTAGGWSAELEGG